jgi:transcriptional regulator with XRE-family HTH domain
MFWENFVKLSANFNKSTTAVVLELGISRGSVTSWKKGAVPNNTTLLKIANYFNVSVDFLLNGDAEEKEKPLEELKEPDEKDTEILAMYSRLSDEQKKQALSYLEYLAQHKASEDTQ